MRHHYTPVIDWPKFRTLTTPNAAEDMEQKELSFICWWECKMVQLLWKSLAVSYGTKYTLIQFSTLTPWCLPKGVENLVHTKSAHTCL